MTKIYVMDSTGERFNYYESPEPPNKRNWVFWSTVENHFKDEEHPITINIL